MRKEKIEIMNAFFYGIASFFEAIFSVLPAIGGLVNVLFILIGFVATAGWIWYMNKNKGDKGVYHHHHE